MSDTVGRNDPCPCGSGLKCKYCCGKPTPPADILYVHPAKQAVDVTSASAATEGRSPGRPYGLIPLGLPGLVNLLRGDGFEVSGINYPLERQYDPTFDLSAWLGQHRSAWMILIDLHWYEHSYGAISVARLCKEVLPNAVTVLGGLTASGFPREILERFQAVDFVIRGDAETPLRQLAQHLRGGAPERAAIPNLIYRHDGEIRETPCSYCAATEDLNRLDSADVTFLQNHETYLAHEYIVVDVEATRRAMEEGHPYRGRWIATARGCKYECSYCGGCKSAHRTLAGREGLILRSPEAVVDELQWLAERGIQQASLSYDIAELGEDYWRRLLSLLRRREIKIGLYNELFQLPDPRFIKHFARSVDMTHSCLALSPLSGNERVRRLNGKRYTDSELINILDHLNLYNVPIFVYFSLNLPGEDETTIKETIALAETIVAHYPGSLLKILNSCHTMDPFSPMQQHPEKFGITALWSSFRDFYDYCRETQFATPAARTSAWRGFELSGPDTRAVEAMADAWDAARQGHEASWWPIPPSW